MQQPVSRGDHSQTGNHTQNDQKNHGVWCCDPCGKGGDVFRFVMDHQGVSFLDAVDFVVGRYGVESDAVTSESAPW